MARICRKTGVAKCVCCCRPMTRGGVEPLAGLAVRLREFGAAVRMYTPPDCAERLAAVGVPLVPVGQPARPLVHGATPPLAADVPGAPRGDRRARTQNMRTCKPG